MILITLRANLVNWRILGGIRHGIRKAFLLGRRKIIVAFDTAFQVMAKCPKRILA